MKADSRWQALVLKLCTYWKLGPINVWRVGRYRIAKKLRYHVYALPAGQAIEGTLLGALADTATSDAAIVRYFSCHDIPFPDGPTWFANPWRHPVIELKDDRHWSLIGDFDAQIGDIKTLWELSRFDWVPKWAWHIAQSPDTAENWPLERWLQNWCRNNPVNTGRNWKCGQEASFRILNLLISARILHVFDTPCEGLRSFVHLHLRRIRVTVEYAMGQDNNHGTSEAAALYIGGAWLAKFGNAEQRVLGLRCLSQGEHWLLDRVRHLIMDDGSFSQHSVTYHRLVLDTLSLVELFRRELTLPVLDEHIYYKARLASRWLASFTDPVSGDAPNLGSNDGAYLFNIDDKPYRDFRPSVVLATTVFDLPAAFHAHTHALLSLFKVSASVDNAHYDTPDKACGNTHPIKQESTHSAYFQQPLQLFADGGYARLVAGNCWAMLRLPIYSFRPCNCDALHLDLWCAGVNVIRDAGSYSYNADDPAHARFFSGTQSHSTVMFDGRNQMPKVSRFLIGGWLSSDHVTLNTEQQFIESQYTDHLGASHRRRVAMEESSTSDCTGVVATISDTVAGFTRLAECRWRLAPGEWVLDEQACHLTGPDTVLRWHCDVAVQASLIHEGESHCYLEYHEIPVLVLSVKSAGTLTTQIQLLPGNQLAQLRESPDKKKPYIHRSC